MEKLTNSKVFIEIEYEDESSFTFDVIGHEESSNAYHAEILMITRGTLMASGAYKATAYNEEGFPIAAYYK